MSRIESGFHRNENDLIKYVYWCRSYLNKYSSSNWVSPDHTEQFEEQKDGLDDELDELLEKYVGTGNVPARGDPEGNKIFYQLRGFAHDEGDFTWGAWIDTNTDLTKEDGSPIGYGKEVLQSSTLHHQEALLAHRYSDYPSSIVLDLASVEQGDKKVYVGHAPASEIDAICSVPHLDPTLEAKEFAELVYTGNLGDEQWQRVVDVKRIRDIANFIEAEDSYIFNPVLLYVDKNHPSITEKKKLNGKGKLEVSFDFLLDRKEGFVDYVPKPGQGDVRPFKICDGQHRIRGLAMSERGHLLNIPFVLIVGENPEVDRKLIAKIFTEINTKSVQIESLHRLYLMYKFGMQGLTNSDDFSVNADMSPTAESRPQRNAYELALFLCSVHGGPLEDMIEFQRPSTRKRRRGHIVVNSVSWVGAVRKWFTANKIYSDFGTDVYYKQEVLNFFLAFQEICSMNWRTGNERWQPQKGRGKPLLQFEGPFLSLLELYPILLENITNKSGHERPLKKEVFIEKLTPLKNVDWLDVSILNSPLKGRTNLNIRHLVMWMITAIENGEETSSDEILDRTEQSVPGKGIIARPSPVEVEFISYSRWPSDGPVQARIKYPAHTLGCNWIVRFYDSSGQPESWDYDKRENVATTREGSEITIQASDIGAGVSKISIAAELYNAMGDTLTKEQVISSL